ncbi:hypothetical protein VTO73DRAFT_8810 [Trametes versicolor]
MSIEPAPSDILRESHWPRLRDLVLRGEAASHLETPYVITLGNMSELRSLELGLRLLPGVAAPMVWPPAYDVACPWPHLQSFTTPALAELALEFVADNRELDLWQYLPRAFPRLCSLTVNVYRADENHSDIPVRRIAQALALLAHLKTLRTYLGFQPVPSRDALYNPAIRTGFKRIGPAGARPKIQRDRAAQTLTDMLAPSLRTIVLMHPTHTSGVVWIMYRVVPGKRRPLQQYLSPEQFYELRCARGVLLVAPELQEHHRKLLTPGGSVPSRSS